MEPTIVDQAAFTVVGVVGRASPGRHDYAALWSAFSARAGPVQAVAGGNLYYGVHLSCEEPEVVDYLAGMSVPSGTAVAGMETREVPAGRYAAFSCTMATIGRTFGYVYGGWQPPEGWQIDHTRPDIEAYTGEGPEAPAEIRIPLTPTVR